MKIVWSPQARNDLRAVFHYIAEDNAQAARVLLERIVKQIETLPGAPHIGRPGRVPGTRELMITGTPYIAPYRMSGTRLEILRIYHGARKWPERF